MIRALQDARSVSKFIWTHPSNKGRRVRAVARAASFQVRGRLLHQRALAPLGSSSRIWVDLHRTAGSKSLYANPPDHPEMVVWRRWLRRGDVFIDVGANVGTYTIWAADLGATVVALEPAPDTCALLRENVALNGYPVEVIEAAAGAEPGTVRFTAGRDCLNQVDASGEAEVAVVVLDDVIGTRRVRGVKVDVEGFELEVLRGCRSALAEGRIDLMQLEWNDASVNLLSQDRQAVADFLHEYGYEIYRPNATADLVPFADPISQGVDVFALRP